MQIHTEVTKDSSTKYGVSVSSLFIEVHMTPCSFGWYEQITIQISNDERLQ